MRVNKIIIFAVILCQLANNNATVSIPGINRIKNKVEQSVNNITRLTKENFNKFVKKADGYRYTKENILENLLTPKKIFINEINEQIKNFNWSTDYNLIEAINKNDNPINYLTQKSKAIHINNMLAPILLISNDLQEEAKIIDGYIIETQKFLAEEKKIDFKIQIDILNPDLTIYLNKLLELKNNIFIIANYLNSLFTVNALNK